MARRTRKTKRAEPILEKTAAPLFLLDARRRVIFFNDGCRQLTGWSEEEIAGLVCEFASGSAPSQAAAVTETLCPPPELFSSLKPVSVPVNVPHRSGPARPRMIHFFPLVSAEEQLEAVLGLIAPIQQPHRRAETTQTRRLHVELASLKNTLRHRFGTSSLVARSQPMQRVLQQITLARASTAGFLLRGEPGSGKEHIARLVHYESDDRTRAFVPIPCGETPTWELKATFNRLLKRDDETEETRGGVARLPILQPGTLYLQDVEQLPRDLQQRLVEAVRNGTADFRLCASTSVDLREKLRDESLREDLYYLLTALEIDVPPLRRRGEDLLLLAQSFLEQFNRGSEKQVAGFSEEVQRKFREYNWPGNADELQTVVKEARAVCEGDTVEAGDLPFRFRTGLDAQSISPAAEPRPKPLKELLEETEREQIERTLAQCRYNKTRAAELLGMTRPRLYRRMQSLGIEDREEG